MSIVTRSGTGAPTAQKMGADHLGHERSRTLAGAGELDHVGAVVIALHHAGQRTALAQRGDVTQRGHLGKHSWSPYPAGRRAPAAAMAARAMVVSCSTCCSVAALEKRATHRLDMSRGGGCQGLQSAFGEDGTQPAPVVRIRLAAHQAGLLQAADRIGTRAAGEERPVSELAHPQRVFRFLRQAHQDLVVGVGEPAVALQLVVDRGIQELHGRKGRPPGRLLGSGQPRGVRRGNRFASIRHGSELTGGDLANRLIGTLTSGLRFNGWSVSARRAGSGLSRPASVEGARPSWPS